MESDHVHKVHSILHAPKLPHDVLCLVARVSSFETVASLLRCNKSLHTLCVPLLFREIRFHKAIQLVKLCGNQKALKMLSETESMFLGEDLFRMDVWNEGIIPVLRAATSLRRLQIFSTPALIYVSDYLIRKLDSMSSDRTFLPNLEILVGTRAVPLLPPRDNRALKFLCTYEDIDETVVEVYPSLSTGPVLSPTTRSAVLESAHNLSASEIGTLIRESKGNLLVKYPYLNLTVRFPEEIRTDANAPIPDLLAWLQEVIWVADLSSDSPERLRISLEPSTYLPVWEQYTVVTGIYELLPRLERVNISWNVTWRRDKSRPQDSQNPLPLWTPKPGDHTINWWLDALHLSFTGTKTREEAEQIGTQLRKDMGRLYGSALIPSIDSVVHHLLGRNVSI